MTKTSKRLATNQISLDFDLSIETCTRLRNEIFNTPRNESHVENYEEACIELAAIIKDTIRDTGKSRDEIVDAINHYFGWATNDKRKCLTLAMFNNYLSKPTQYPMPVVIMMATQHICRSLKPISFLAELEGGKVISWEEVRELNIGKAEKIIKESQRMKKRMLGGR